MAGRWKAENSEDTDMDLGEHVKLLTGSNTMPQNALLKKHLDFFKSMLYFYFSIICSR